MRMRSFACTLLLSAFLATGLAVAQERSPATGAEATEPPPPTREERIDTLIETLQTAENDRQVRQAEQSLLRLWMESDSDTIDLLMRWAADAVQSKRYSRALDFLDRVVIMQPDFAEGWNKRATVHFLMEEYGRSLDDIAHVLALEPRHFGALSGLGMILQSMEETERAKIAFEQALAVNPHLDDVREALETLKQVDEGKAL